MSRFVDWWCALIGITDPLSVQVAVGMAGAITLYLAVYTLWYVFWWVFAVTSDWRT